MATSVEVKKAISELENTKFVNNGDLLMLSRVYGALGNYHSYNVNVEDFLSSALSDYHNIKDWVWELINNLSSKVLDEKFVHKVGNLEENINGNKLFSNPVTIKNQAPTLYLNNISDDIQSVPSNTKYYSIYGKDKNNNNLGGIQVSHTSAEIGKPSTIGTYLFPLSGAWASKEKGNKYDNPYIKSAINTDFTTYNTIFADKNYINGKTIFNNAPSCQNNPVNSNELVRQGYLNNYVLTSNVANTLGNSTVKVASQNLLSTNLNTLNSNFYGDDGKVLYISSKGSIKQQINEKILVCENSDEVEKSKKDSTAEQKASKLVDLAKKEVLEYDNATNTWKKVSGQTPLSFLKAGRMSYNAVTRKLFFNNGTEIYSISIKSDFNEIIDATAFTDSQTRVPSSHLVKGEIESIKSSIQTQLTKLNKIV